MSQPESRLSRAIMGALRARGIWCFKVHGGPTMMAGVPDIIACVPVKVDIPAAAWIQMVGQFVGFETKMPGGRVSTIQAKRHDDIHASEGLVCVPRTVCEALTFVDGITGTPHTEPCS
jgi:hypothetical protein